MESDESNDTSSESANEDDTPQKFSRSKRSSTRESLPSSKSSSPSRSPSSSSSSSESEKSVENADNEQASLEKPDSPKSLTNGNCESSPKSISSKSSSKSKISHESEDSDDSRDRRKAANLDDGNTSCSSETSNDSSRSKAKSKTTNADLEPEGVSEDEHNTDKIASPPKLPELPGNLNITHEDLSDVSDLEDSIDQSDEEMSNLKENNEIKDVYQNRDKKSVENDGEEQLDFEAEDGECADTEPTKQSESKNEQEAGELDDETDSKRKSKDDLEEGEISDEDEVRPEETEPRPVCRFFSRGQCTWGASCRFLHPGVTDKGNYTMFDIVRPVVPGDYVNERPPFAGRADPPPTESAWERGLRTAKEMMRKSIKRKEQDIDFEEKKMNLSIAQEELDKENGYYAKVPTPEPRYVSLRHAPPHDDYPPIRIAPQEYYGRRPIVYDPPEYIPQPPRERIRYREVPAHRAADYYSTKHDDEPSMSASSSSKLAIKKKPRGVISRDLGDPTSATRHEQSRKTKREVIVQRHEDRSGRGDEWSDPWMRSKSPASRKGAPRKRSYSSGSSYSSSSSSASSKSSYRSRSQSKHKRSPRRPRRQVSPSVIVSERKAANERAALMNPPAPRKKPPSPGMMRVGAQNPPAPVKVDQFGRTRSKLAVAAALARVKGRTRSSRSSSGSSSGSSSSESESSGSSTSSGRNASPSPRRPGAGVDLAMALKAKAIDALKSGSEKRQIKLNLKNTAVQKKSDLVEVVRKADASRKRLASSPPAGEPTKAISNKKASSRREELLKQLKAVEDAIAKKRSKV